jgi:hypothetical protein
MVFQNTWHPARLPWDEFMVIQLKIERLGLLQVGDFRHGECEIMTEMEKLALAQTLGRVFANPGARRAMGVAGAGLGGYGLFRGMRGAKLPPGAAAPRTVGTAIQRPHEDLEDIYNFAGRKPIGAPKT